MTRLRSTPPLLVLPLLAVLLAGCGDSDPGFGADATASDSPVETTGPTTTPSATHTPAPGRYPDFAPTDYAYTLTLSCYCPDAGMPIRVTVADDEVVAAVYLREGGRSGAVAGADVPLARAATIDEVIEAANTEDAHRVEVDWPEGQDHPSSVSVDRSKRVMDEEIGYRVRDVEVAVAPG